MNTTPQCPSCGKALTPTAPKGLCQECLLKAGFPTDSQECAAQAEAGAFVPPAPEELAARFPQLEIIELIGRGGMGAVYKARQKKLGRLVALKILPPGIGDHITFAARFTREAQALANLNHPGIVTLYEFGETEELFFFLMEFVDGVNLRQLLNGGRISAREALAIVPQICDALQYAHDHGVVHRDIKPENILLDRQGRVKVADFGVAKIVGQMGAESASGAASEQSVTGVLGTPHYMAPEQRDRPTEVDHRADIYALGVVFYQMLTGELPGKQIQAPSKKVHIDVRLDEIVLRALEKTPERRYAQASGLKADVETVSSTPSQTFQKRVVAHPELLWGNISFAMAAIGVVAALVHWRDDNRNAGLGMLIACGILAWLMSLMAWHMAKKNPNGGWPLQAPLSPESSIAARIGRRMRNGWINHIRSLIWELPLAALIAVALLMVIAPLRLKTDAVDPEIPKGSYVIANRLSKQFEERDIVAFRRNGQVWLGRAISAGPTQGVLEVARSGEANQAVQATDIIGKVIFHTRTKTDASSKSTHPAPFTASIKHVLYSFSTQRPIKGYDMDEGKEVEVPTDLEKQGEDVLIQWSAEHGIDLLAFSHKKQWDLWTPLKLASITGVEWEKVTVEDIDSALNDGTNHLTLADPSVKHGFRSYKITGLSSPELFAFRTVSGNRGLLQIGGFSESPAGVKVQYKLVNQAANKNIAERRSLYPTVTLTLAWDGSQVSYPDPKSFLADVRRMPEYQTWLKTKDEHTFIQTNAVGYRFHARFLGMGINSESGPQELVLGVDLFRPDGSLLASTPLGTGNPQRWDTRVYDATGTTVIVRLQWKKGSDPTEDFVEQVVHNPGTAEEAMWFANRFGVVYSDARERRYPEYKDAPYKPASDREQISRDKVPPGKTEIPNRQRLQFRLVAEQSDKGILEEFSDPRTATHKLRLRPQMLMDETSVAAAFLTKNQVTERPEIELILTETGKDLFAQITREHINQQIAILFDNAVLTAPVVNSEIPMGRLQITGDLAQQLSDQILFHLNRVIVEDEDSDSTLPGFGPIRTATVNAESARDDGYDLDTGRMASPPDFTVTNQTKTLERIRHEQSQWLKSGIDLLPDLSMEAPRLVALCRSVIATPTASWTNLPSYLVRQQLTLEKADTMSLIGTGQFPATYLFKTAQTNYGILQILGLSAQPRGIVFRYKLAELEANKAAINSDGIRPNQPTATEAPTVSNRPKPNSIVAALATFLGLMMGAIWICRSDSRFACSSDQRAHPRLSRSAILGAAWAFCFLLTVVLWSPFGLSAAIDLRRSLGHDLVNGILLSLTIVGVSAVLGTTLLGFIALSQIRHSRGHLSGLPLALFGSLLFPLLTLDALLVAIATAFKVGPIEAMLVMLPLNVFLIRKICSSLTRAQDPVADNTAPLRRHHWAGIAIIVSGFVVVLGSVYVATMIDRAEKTRARFEHEFAGELSRLLADSRISYASMSIQYSPVLPRALATFRSLRDLSSGEPRPIDGQLHINFDNAPACVVSGREGLKHINHTLSNPASAQVSWPRRVGNTEGEQFVTTSPAVEK